MHSVIDILDLGTQCVIDTVDVDTARVAEICSALKIEGFEPSASYELGEADLTILRDYFGAAFGTNAVSAVMRPKIWIDDLPYKTHTNRELMLMLAGTKPLASFSDSYPGNSESQIIPDSKFERYVGMGSISRREYVELRRHHRIRRVLFALPSEEWRIDAYITMLNAASSVGWNDGFERMEGYLLGYEEWQCDAYFEARKKRAI